MAKPFELSPDLPTCITNEAIESSILQFASRLDEKFLGRLMKKEAMGLMDLPIYPNEKLMRLMALVAQAADIIYAAKPACVAKCSHCCNMATVINNHEAHVIGKVVGIKPQNVGTLLPDRERMIVQFRGVPCTFLKDNKCSIYDHRPLPCRTYFNISAFPELCDLKRYPGSEVPGLDWSMVCLAEVMIYGEHAKYADIREFFPAETTLQQGV